MDISKLKKLSKLLSISFSIIVAWIVAAVLLALIKESILPSLHYYIALVVGIPSIVASWIFIITLWRLARALNRSPIVWVGLTIITSPIGLFIAYFLMHDIVTNAFNDGSQVNLAEKLDQKMNPSKYE